MSQDFLLQVFSFVSVQGFKDFDPAIVNNPGVYNNISNEIRNLVTLSLYALTVQKVSVLYTVQINCT